MLEPPGENELVLIRHAPVATPGYLYGRTDAPARLPEVAELESLRRFLASCKKRATSPALRCRQTAAELWGGDDTVPEDPRLWEQDFGDWEGLAFADLPNIGSLSGEALAAHRPPQGESFDDLCARAIPALLDLGASGSGPTAAVVHAGIVRACVAHAIGSTAQALRFDVACLSVSRFILLADEECIVRSVNQQF